MTTGPIDTARVRAEWGERGPQRKVVRRLCREIDTLRRANLALAERLAAASEVLSRAAERRPDLVTKEAT